MPQEGVMAVSKSACFYISGHGFGHASRTMQVIKSLVELTLEVSIHIKTSTPRWFIESNLSPDHYTYHFQENDIGVVQKDSLNLLPEETFQAFEAFFGRREKLIHQEKEWLIQQGVGLIVSDIPPVAFEVARRAQVPGVGVSNFSWDWIYEPFLDDFPQYRNLVEQIREAYGLCDQLYRLPFHGDFSAFPHIIDKPLIARTSKRDKLDTRRLLGLPEKEKLILCSFGGIGIDNPVSFNGSSFGLIFTTEKVIPASNTWTISPERMRSLSISYEDLVATSDAILTKLGYGIVSEAIANKTPLLYVDISAFREQPVFRREISDWIPALPISRNSLFGGGWEEAAEKLLEMELPQKTMPVNGAEIIAQDLAHIIGSA
jgi:L-arabinokinase